MIVKTFEEVIKQNSVKTIPRDMTKYMTIGLRLKYDN